MGNRDRKWINMLKTVLKMFAWILKNVFKNKSKIENKIVSFSAFLNHIEKCFWIILKTVLVLGDDINASNSVVIQMFQWLCTLCGSQAVVEAPSRRWQSDEDDLDLTT